MHFEELADRTGIGNMKGSFGGADTVVLSGAEADFATAPCVTKALSAFASRGMYGFTLPDEAYRSAVKWWMQAARGLDIQTEWIVPTLGTTYALATAVRAFTEKDGGVIIQHPSYYRFDRAILRNHRRVISNPMKEENGAYALDFAHLEACMADPANKLLVLVNPHNPTGKVFAKDDLLRIAALARRYRVTVFSDEIFAETAQPEHPCVPYVEIDPENGITSTSLGKAFSFTGVNHANLIIPNDDLRQRYLTQRDEDHFGSLDPFFYNALMAAYTPEGFSWVREMTAHVKRIHELVKRELAGTPIGVSPLEGSFVGWLDCRKLGLSDERLDDFFLNTCRIMPDPGWEYGPGGSGFIRINLATTTSQMQRALTALKEALP